MRGCVQDTGVSCRIWSERASFPTSVGTCSAVTFWTSPASWIQINTSHTNPRGHKGEVSQIWHMVTGERARPHDFTDSWEERQPSSLSPSGKTQFHATSLLSSPWQTLFLNHDICSLSPFLGPWQTLVIKHDAFLPLNCLLTLPLTWQDLKALLAKCCKKGLVIPSFLQQKRTFVLPLSYHQGGRHC